MGRLTDARIRSLKPGSRDRFVGDGSSLWLRVRTSGAKVFILRLRHAGRTRILTLGHWPEYSLLEARARAAQEASAARARRRGEAPPLVHHVRVAAVADLAKEYFERVVTPTYRRTKSAKVYRDWLVAELGTVKLRAVTHAALAAALKDYAERAPVAANRCLAFTKQCFRYAVQSGYLEHSPAAQLDRSIAGGREASRERVLTDAELRKLWHAEGPHRALLRFLLCTLARIGEAQRARWGDVTGARWTIPAAHAKNKRATWVHLSAPALEALGERGEGLLFASVSPTAVQGWVRRFCERSGIEPTFTPHDLRRTGATRMGELGIAPHVVARCLNHTIAVSDSIAVYFRAELEPERVEAFDKWGAELLRIVHQPLEG